jgi:putative CocE/NonD family hydrolase
VHDPADAVPSEGGASTSRPGAIALALAESRGDVLRWVGEPLLRSGELSGHARVMLFVSSDAVGSDFTARLVRIDASGAPFHLCDGITRVEKLAASPAPVAIELSPILHRLHAGERLRLDVASSSFPRFDRHGNTAAPPAGIADEACRAALHRVHHGARHPSCIRLPWLR